MNHAFESALNHLDALRSVSGSALCQHLSSLQNSSSTHKFDLSMLDQARQILLDAIQGALLAGEPPVALAARIAKIKRRRFPSLNALTVTQATQALDEIKRLRQLAIERNTVSGSRKLDKYRQEIGVLFHAKASQRDILLWLKREKCLKISQTSIHRYLQEMKAHGEIRSHE